MKQIFHFIGVAFLLLALSTCDNKEENAPATINLGLTKNFTNSGCKGSFRGFLSNKKEVEEVILKAIEGGYLDIAHLNLKDYCEREDAYSISTSVEGHKLTIKEVVENGAMPKCYCAYDLGVQIGGFEVGETYTLVFKRDKWTFARVSFVYTSDFKQSIPISKSKKH